MSLSVFNTACNNDIARPIGIYSAERDAISCQGVVKLYKLGARLIFDFHTAFPSLSSGFLVCEVYQERMRSVILCAPQTDQTNHSIHASCMHACVQG